MKLTALSNMLDLLSAKGIFTFSNKMLYSYFPAETTLNFKKTIERAITAGILERACRGIYLYKRGMSNNNYPLESIALILRSGEHSYISLETALSELSIISQMTINHLTVMTSGRSQTYKTPYGTIELTHTNRSERDIIENTYKQDDRPMRVAKPDLALTDLKRTQRNVHLVDINVFNEVCRELKI